MPEDSVSKILIIDDDDTSHDGTAIFGESSLRTRHPNDIGEDDIVWADLILMDYSLDEWPERDRTEQLSLRPMNGLALSALLREHADKELAKTGSYTTFALHTGRIEEVSSRLQTSSMTVHTISRLNNIEWIFDKSDSSRFAEAAQLADTTKTISHFWQENPCPSIEVTFASLLNAPKTQWRNRAYNDVLLCQIPIHTASSKSNGILLLRWLLHTILPYPTFLLEKHWVAANLGISISTLEMVLGKESPLASKLQECLYTGVLARFLGKRWWRSGLEQFTWELKKDSDGTLEEFHKKLEGLAEMELESLNCNAPVVCLNKSLEPNGTLIEIEKALRIIPDAWPLFADNAYISKEYFKDQPELSSLLHPYYRITAEIESADLEKS